MKVGGKVRAREKKGEGFRKGEIIYLHKTMGMKVKWEGIEGESGWIKKGKDKEWKGFIDRVEEEKIGGKDMEVEEGSGEKVEEVRSRRRRSRSRRQEQEQEPQRKVEESAV